MLDKGIRTTHGEFGGRATADYTSILDGWGANDCISGALNNGHGTHVAGTIGAATYGVAKGVRLHAVRVLDCDGFGTYSQIIAGVDWVTSNRQNPAVVNMSLSGPGSTSLDTAVQNSIDSGIVYVVAAGNDNGLDACQFSPARVGAALTVGAAASSDVVASFSNQGSCPDLFAPGVGVLSTSNTSDTATQFMDGTSMAAPHVAGVAAAYRAANPSATASSVVNAVVGQATSGVVTGRTAGSPDALLFSPQLTCEAGRTLCQGACVATQTDPNNCGSCGHVCSGTKLYCVSGACSGCPAGYYDCCRDGQFCAVTRSQCPPCP